MCISYEWSIFTYVAGLAGSLYLMATAKQKSVKWIGIFVTYLLQMQLLEAMMWSDTKCKNGLNVFSSKIAYYFTLFQPLVGNLAAYYLIKNKQILLLLIPYVLYTMYFIKNNYPSESELCTQPCDGHLKWDWLKFGFAENGDVSYGLMWYISFFLPMLFLLKLKNSSAVYVTFLYIFVSSLYAFKSFVFKTAPSLWCIFQLATPYIAILFK